MYIHIVDRFRRKNNVSSKRINVPNTIIFWPIILTLSTIISKNTIIAYHWTEADESKRIANLKQEERRYFEKQFGTKLPTEKSSSNEPIDYEVSQYSQFFPTFQPPNIYKEHKHSEAHHRHHHKHYVSSNNEVKKRSNHWCFHCISPWATLSSDLRQVILNLLEVRRASAPGSSSVILDCTQPTNLTALPHQRCHQSYCQTLVLTDHDTGSAFTLRGCAENFGAIDENLIKSRGDNTCKRLHDVVDIQECICKHRKYCYAGPQRSLYYNVDYALKEDTISENNNGEITVHGAKFERRVQHSSAFCKRTHIFILVTTIFVFFLL